MKRLRKARPGKAAGWCRELSIVVALTMMPVYAGVNVGELSTPELSLRYRALIAEYRCPKCQNQNLAESDSPISADLRRRVAEMLENGATDQQISDYLVARYGDFILYRPRLQTTTYLLWLMPLGLVLMGSLVVVLVVRAQRNARSDPSKGLDELQRRQLQALISSPDDNAKIDETRVS